MSETKTNGESPAPDTKLPETNAPLPPPADAPPISAPAKVVTADTLAAPLISAMPGPSGTSALPIVPPLAGTAEHIAKETDSRGVEFDPALHVADDNGRPKRNKKGYFYSKNIGRGGAARLEEDDDEPKVTFAGLTDPAGEGTPDAKAQGLAEMFVPLLDGAMQNVFTEGVALTETDKKQIMPIAAGYIKAKGMTDVPPGVALTLALVGIYAPKFTKPTVKERCALLYMKLSAMFKKKTS